MICQFNVLEVSKAGSKNLELTSAKRTDDIGTTKQINKKTLRY